MTPGSVTYDHLLSSFEIVHPHVVSLHCGFFHANLTFLFLSFLLKIFIFYFTECSNFKLIPLRCLSKPLFTIKHPAKFHLENSALLP